jgi:hypothetical protein
MPNLVRHSTGVIALLASLGLTAAASADHASVGLGGGAGSPIYTESAITLPAGRWSTSLRSEYNNFSRIANPQLADSERHSVDILSSTALGLSYGVTDDLTLGLRLPYIERQNVREADHHVYDHGHGAHHHTDRILDLGDPEGLGDATLFGEYRFLRSADQQTHLAALFGVKLPTGATHRKSSGERLETEFQPGSGSTDGLLGVAATHLSGAISYDASLLYSLVTTGAQHTDMGDVLGYNLAASYRLGGERPANPYDLTQPHAWDLILELNGEHRERVQIHGQREENSGGNIVYLSPGVRYLNKTGWGLALSLGVPVAENLNGTQADPDYRVLSSLNVAF